MSFDQGHSYEYVSGGTNQWAEPIPVQPPREAMFNSNLVVEMYEEDLRGESSFDLQDVILLDFAEELLG